MKIERLYIIKFWGYLQKLFNPEKESLWLIRKQMELSEYADAKSAHGNNIAQATNVALIFHLYDAGEGIVILRDRLGPEYGLARQSFGSSLIADCQYTEQTAIKEQRKGKQSVTESERRSL
jgi:hypothetical protein